MCLSLRRIYCHDCKDWRLGQRQEPSFLRDLLLILLTFGLYLPIALWHKLANRPYVCTLCGWSRRSLSAHRPQGLGLVGKLTFALVLVGLAWAAHS